MKPKIPPAVASILSLMGLSSKCRIIPGSKSQAGWKQYRFPKSDGGKTPVPALFFEHKVKTISDAKRQVSNAPSCIALFHLKSDFTLFFKSGQYSKTFKLESGDAFQQIRSALSASGLASADTMLDARLAIRKVVENIPTTTKNFNNRGVFSTHYLKTRLLDSAEGSVQHLETAWEADAQRTLSLLGWADLAERDGVHRSDAIPNAAIIIVESGTDFGIQRAAGDVAPSYKAVAELENATWVILTDGMIWRLYTSRVSASTTNYFEISLNERRDIILQYLAAIFGAAVYEKSDGKARIDTIFDEGKNYVRELEENLSERILKPNGIFVDMVKGVLKHDWKRRYTNDELKTAKKNVLKIMYRVWFLMYAESRDLLPVKDDRYAPLSLTSLRVSLDNMEESPESEDCWKHVLNLFKGVRNGSPQHNLPQYSGGLFKQDSEIDCIAIKNRHFVRAIRGLLENDGEPIDYASLGVRHLGNIYETLMEFVIRQADRDIMLLEHKGGMREVESKAESTYTYRKNDLYIVSKAGFVSRKSSGSYYTPQKIVEFLVSRGLEPILRKREDAIPNDIRRYKRSQTSKDRQACMDRILDIQVCDPAMGSGDFLVEALNQLTRWATKMLKKYPSHPLLHEIEHDRQTIISTQKERGISINENLLAHDVLLKRHMMKRCIYGVDSNPLAVELARVSLWLDSFAIGVPLTYLNHHIKRGDSTIGAWRKDIEDTEWKSLDNWMKTTDQIGGIIERISQNADITIEQVRTSEDAHDEYERDMAPHKRMLDVWCAAQMNDKIIPRMARKNIIGYIQRLMNPDKNDADMARVIEETNKLHDRYGFFHWELEMMDAFTDARYGFDLIVGNPPWDTVKPKDDEFFTNHYPTFKSISTKTKKKAMQKEILKNSAVKSDYEYYRTSFREKSAFYGTYNMQGRGDRDMWKLMLERMLGLVDEGGFVSIVVPSSVLSSTGPVGIRKRILNSDIQQVYVFENRKKIFPIDSRYRFLLLTVRNAAGPDVFEAGFYLHDLRSLENRQIEADKFHTMSKEMIRNISPDMLHIPEVGGRHLSILAKIYHSGILGLGFSGGWSVALTRGFDRTTDAGLLKDDIQGWPVLEGKHIHQFNHDFARPQFASDMFAGLAREAKKRVYKNKHHEFYHSFRLAFRSISSPTNMRTIISAIIPPQWFHANSMSSIVLTHNGHFKWGNDYNKMTAYLCGVLNSMSFDFAARSKVQMNVAPVIKTLPTPPPVNSIIMT